MPDRPLKALVKSPFSIMSGYGNDGFGILRALSEWGCDVYAQPTWLDVPIPRDLMPVFGKELRPPFDLLINHWDPAHLSITREARGCSRVAVAWTMWEFAGGPGPQPCRRHLRNPAADCPPASECPRCRPGPVSGLVPHCKGRTKMASALKWFDLVLGYDPVSLDALSPFIPPKVASGILQGGFDAREWKFRERDWSAEPGTRFGFLMHGALNARKAPWTAIEAFNQLKFEKPGPGPDGFGDATLALHTNAPGLIFPELNGPFEGQRIRVFVDAFDKATLEDFYYSGHCLLSPSRGEGKNLPGLEMSATGGVVAGTDFGGHKQWLNGDIGYPLDYELGPTFEQFPWAAHDAKVSVAHLKEQLWHIYTHRAEARRKAELASRLVPQMCDWSVVVEDLFRRIRDTVPVVGPQVYDKAMACRREAESRRRPPMASDGWWRPA
jgi:glycosyltransferase involved in cell wall biosynthesis